MVNKLSAGISFYLFRGQSDTELALVFVSFICSYQGHDSHHVVNWFVVKLIYF